uniref:Major facilitator superfamily (MFS) profile domain-containing protein n=2 Tax=Eptatretus burgeri TaxID=7764 RepID=A0A8C4Q8I2_EPTBU
MANFAYLGGLLVGGIVLGGLADKYGRRKMMILSHILVGVSGIFATFAPNIFVYTISRFFVAFGAIGSYINAFTLGFEWLDVKHHVKFSSFSSYTYSFGHFILAGLAYVMQDWHHLQLATTSIHFLFFITACFHPESARWLLLQGRHEEALKLLKRVARINGKHLTEADLNIHVLTKEMEEKNIPSDNSASLLDLIRVKELRKQTIILSISWFTILFCYYGIALNLEVIKVNIFLLLVIFGVLDLPMLLASMAMMSYFGRRIVLSGLFLLSSCAFFALTLTPADHLVVRAAFAVIGRMAIATSYNANMLLTGELYPTVVRQNSLGMMSMIAQVGTLMAPLIILSRDMYLFLPELSFALLSMISGLLALLLPETFKTIPPDTMEDLIRQRKRHNTHEYQEESDGHESLRALR